MIKNIITLIKAVRRWFKNLVFKIRHKEGWEEGREEEFAKKVLASGNGAVPIEETRAFNEFVRRIRTIEKSKKLTEAQKKIRIIKEKYVLHTYGFQYRHPDKETRIRHEGMKKAYILKHGRLPHFSFFSAQLA